MTERRRENKKEKPVKRVLWLCALVPLMFAVPGPPAGARVVLELINRDRIPHHVPVSTSFAAICIPGG